MNFLLEPIISEKTLALYERSKIVTFRVGLSANKYSVKAQLLKIYPSIKIGSVNVLNRLGKYKLNSKRRKIKKSPDTKIVYVKLASGEIDIFKKT
jgi:ribosomal protein L23